MSSLRSHAFEIILDEIKSNKYKKILIDTHAQFFWNNVFENAYDWKYLNQMKTDLFLTIIDSPCNIRKNQLKIKQGKSQNHNLKRLLLWQNVEVNVTKGWVENYEKQHYVLPRKQNPEIIDNLLENQFLVYFSMPMTNADTKANKEISEFYNKLYNLGKKINNLPTPIIDPRTIDLESDENMSLIERKTNESQTVKRDMHWYIPQSTHIIAFYPKGSIISKGVSDETTSGFIKGKEVLVIFPEQKRSPFVYNSTKVFNSSEEFFKFFPKHMKEMLNFYKRT